MGKNPRVKNAADEEQVREAERKDQEDGERELADVRAVLSSREGRRFLWKLLGDFGLARIAKDPSSSDTYFNLGMQNAAFMLRARLIEADEKAWLLMQAEEFTEAKKET